VQFAAGDARKALNLIELIAGTFEPDVENIVTNAMVVKVAQQNIARYDKSGEQHYDLVSAFIKSIRGVILMLLCIGWHACSKAVKIPFLLPVGC
jgi:putative ATPase